MQVIAVDFTIKEEFVSQFRDRIKQQAEDSLTKEPDCHQFDVCFDPNDKTKCFLFQKYTDEAAIEFHRATEYFKDFGTQIKPWVEAKSAKVLTCD